MSASRLVTIFCDAPSCGQWYDAGVSDTAAQARKQLRGTGWATAVRAVHPGPTLDYCPTHVPTPQGSGEGDR